MDFENGKNPSNFARTQQRRLGGEIPLENAADQRSVRLHFESNETLRSSIDRRRVCSLVDLEYQHEYVPANTRLAQRSSLVVGLFKRLLSFGFTRSNGKSNLSNKSSLISSLGVALGTALAFAKV